MILSPHLDDAVLSCWQLLAGPGEVRVINVFDGSPPPGTPPPWWDTITGATDPRERLLERREEDRAALGGIGRSALGLGLLDAQYRDEEVPVSMLVARLGEHVRAGTTVCAPAAIHAHEDHRLVRAAAIELARGGLPLVLYADLPHAIRHGWPGWVSGEPDPLAAAQDWTAALEQAGLAVERLVPRVRPLDAEARGRKLRAVGAYRTQRAGLDALAFAPLEVPGTLAYEVTWEVPRSALPSAGRPEALGEPVVSDPGGEALDQPA
ncbi:MAG: PIG-L family deacetylase [Thermoleophilaceae bacterium]